MIWIDYIYTRFCSLPDNVVIQTETSVLSWLLFCYRRGKTPRPLPAIGNAESTLEKKEKGTPLPEIPKSNKLPPVQMPPVQTTEDPGNEEEREKKRRKKKKKKREEAENEEDDKRDSQNSRGQTNVAMEEEEQAGFILTGLCRNRTPNITIIVITSEPLQ